MKTSITPLDTGIEGTVTLCVKADEVSGTVKTEHLQPGDAYTIWFVYFDDSSQCGDGSGVCGAGPNDLGGDNPLGVFGRFDSAMGPANGKVDFAGSVRGLHLSSGSQVWLLMFGHGPADANDGRHLARQLLTPEDPNVGAPHLGNMVVKSEATDPPLASRIYGFSAVALYEAVVPGTLHNRSLVGQLNGLASVPQPEQNKKYHWPTVANAALAGTIRGIFPSLKPENLDAINALEQSFAAQFQTEANKEDYERSVAQGQAVAGQILGWAATDGYSTFNNCPYVPNPVLGAWEPTPPSSTRTRCSPAGA
jgi:hypothetical protein